MSKIIIEDIKSSPLKIYILEKWERATFYGLSRDQVNISKGKYGAWIKFDEDYLRYCHIGSRTLTWEIYDLILHLVK
jgi:hypothetical protein